MTAATSPRALISPRADFWLLGGASLVVWVAAFVSKFWLPDAAFRPMMQVWAWFGMATLVVNNPHFMASYALAYRQGEAFILRHALQLLVVPFVLVFAIAAALVRWEQIGPRLLGLVVAAMYATVGWHYGKQVWGCMAVTARFEGYPIDAGQRRLILASVFSVWATNLAYAHRGARDETYLGLPIPTLGLPRHVATALEVVSLTVMLAVVVRVFVRNRRGAHGRWPSLRLLVPLVAFYVWWMPGTYEPRFYAFAVPFFHSLQYLPFVVRVERSRGAGLVGTRRHVRLVVGAAALVLAGWLAFEKLPAWGDHRAFVDLGGVKLSFFVIAAAAFINIHHYFIDNVIWRFGQRDVREHLLGLPPAANPAGT